MWYLQIIPFFILMAMALQDFKYRAIHVWLFLLLFSVLGLLKILNGSWTVTFTDLGYNSAFLGLQILSVTIYLSIKQRQLVNIFKIYFGVGDLLFLFSIAAYFSFFNYVIFYLLSLVCCVLVSLLINMYVKSFKNSIPLAGMQALAFALWLGFSWFDPRIVLTSDLQLVNLFGF